MQGIFLVELLEQHLADVLRHVALRTFLQFDFPRFRYPKTNGWHDLGSSSYVCKTKNTVKPAFFHRLSYIGITFFRRH